MSGAKTGMENGEHRPLLIHHKHPRLHSHSTDEDEDREESSPPLSPRRRASLRRASFNQQPLLIDDLDLLRKIHKNAEKNAEQRGKTGFSITVELCLLLFVFSYSLDITVSQQYLYVRIAEDRNYTGPQPGDGASKNCTLPDLNDSEYRSQQDVQSIASRWYTFQFMCFLLPGFLVTTFFGGYSDRMGRKVALVVPLFGNLVASYIFIFTSIYHLPKWVILVGYIVEGLNGSLSLFLMGAFSYIADVTSLSERSFRVLILEAVVGMAFFLSNIVTGFLIEGVGFQVSYLVLMGLMTFNFLYVSHFIRDSTPTVAAGTDDEWEDGNENGGLETFGAYLRRPFAVYCKPDVSGRRRKLFLGLVTFLLYNITVNGRNSSMLLYFLNYPFCWSSVTYGLFTGAALLCMALGSLLLTHFLQKKLGDLLLVHFGLISMMLTSVILANSRFTWTAFIAAVVGCFAIVPTGILRSFASKTVEPQEVGKLYSIAADGGKLIRQNFIYISGATYSLISWVESASVLIGQVLFNSIYDVTLISFRSAIFYVSLGILAACVCLVLYLQRYSAKKRDVAAKYKKQDNKSICYGSLDERLGGGDVIEETEREETASA